jgi:SAM-dependent methyltransferase
MMQPSCTNAAEAWTLFWSDQGRSSRCLARSPEVCERLDRHWAAFASTVSPWSSIIDLGCGSGAVGQALRRAEPRLHVTGIDLAGVAPSDEPGLVLTGNVAMESLPFPDGAFEAAVSQFGYEYADIEAAAAEVARVTAPNGRLSLLVHHEEGPVVAGFRRHRRAVEALTGVRTQAAFFAGNARALADRIAALEQECSNMSVVEAAGRGLYSHIGKDESGRLHVWKRFVEALAPELFMLDTLSFCRAEDRTVKEVVDPLAEHFQLNPPEALTLDGQPLAWIIEGTRFG